jgi:DtxR family manganese transport transcriptional regulator
MRSTHAHSVRHDRTRRDHATETAEDYVEAICEIVKSAGQCRVKHLAERFGVSHVTVTRIVARLKREGLVDAARYGPVRLTRAGQRLAKRSRRRHMIVYEFLSALGVSAETAATDSEGIEHHVSRATLRCMERYTRQS